MRTRCLILFVALCNFSLAADADFYRVNPEDYRAILSQLRPGDTLLLESGRYTDGLPLHGLIGTAKQPIFITGPPSGARAVFIARAGHNTVSIVDSAYVTLRNVELDGHGELVDAVKAEGHAQWAHHIVLENLFIHNHAADQQIVGISTKCPAWGWVIRNNIINGAGTGMYLGDSDGGSPFIGGLIEHNLVVDTVGYNLQIKHQLGRSRIEGMPKGVSSTIIRHNVFSKARNGSTGHLARPNVLVGHFPLTGAGDEDEYLVYGNFFYQNPNEALFQGEGNVALYNNVFVNTYGDAVILRPHHALPRRINVFHNTVLADNIGIAVKGGDRNHAQRVAANAVFAGLPINGGDQQDNLTASRAEAAEYLAAPFAPVGDLDLSPKSDKLSGEKFNSSYFETFPDGGRDYAGRIHNRLVRGAYAGGNNSLLLERKSYPANRKPPS